jgi:prepilin-type N-terminal cleavage/methylation domain-containing protein
MNNSKGFTLVEMMVAAGILAIALAGAMSFFMYQSRNGADSGKLKAARENVSLALMLLQRDIMYSGTGVYGVNTIANPRAFSLVVMPNYGVDNVTGDALNGSPNAALWNIADLPRRAPNVVDDPFLPWGPAPRNNTTFRPDKIYVGYGNFLDASFDVNGMADANTVFKYPSLRTKPTTQPTPMPRDILPPEAIASTNSFVYDLFQYAPGLAVTRQTKPLGGFISVDGGGTVRTADVNWVTTGDPAAGAPAWNFTVTANLTGNVAPAIVYRIAKDTTRETYELQRNGIRIAGGDPDMEVYNLTVKDQSAPNSLLMSVRIDYQVMLTGSQLADRNLHGPDKRTWRKGSVTLQVDPRTVIVSNWPASP